MGEIVSGVASALLEKLATKAYQEIVLACGLKGDVEKLRETMDFIGAYLVDAENKQVKQQSITKWLQQLKEAFFDASDILDEIECETLRNQVVKEYASVTRKVRRFFSCSNPLAFRIKMSRKIRDIRERINDIASTRERFGLVVIDDNDRSLIQTVPWRETHSDLPSRVTGRDREKERVINDLMRPNLKDNKIDIIPIVGIGGLGKTTLAQLAYNDENVADKFPLRMWVCVSEEFEIKNLLLKILKAADRTKRDVQSSSLDQVKNHLCEALRGKKILLVLDDVWNEDRSKWQKLEDVLLCLVDEENKDSKIIVTTRSQEVASIMGNVAPHNLEGLPKEECLALFFKCAFQKGEEEKYPRLKVFGEEIVVKCKGVPLAVVTLGSSLYSKYDERKWKKFRDSELWKLDQSKEGSILPALKLSYNHLPPQLKQCFLLCSIFPKDHDYDSTRLVSFWMAHGLLQPNNDKEEPEYVGELYIRKLIAISFLQHDYDNGINIPLDNIVLASLKMHDLVHDFALSMMISEQAIVINDSKLANEKVRHLSVSNNVSSPFGLKLNKVQTFISPHRHGDGATNFLNWICNQFRNIKVLDFSDSDFQFLPDYLGKMKHLRYLNLSDCSKMEKLPDSICKLQSLQALNLGGCEALKELPSNMGKNLVSLRSLIITAQLTDLSYIDIGHFKCLQILIIGDCHSLVSLPRDLKNLTSLKNLVVGDCSELVRFEDTEDEKEAKKTEVVNDFSLQIFVIGNLPKLTALPNWLTRYAKTSLEMLAIICCPEMSSLPADMDKLCNLQHLYIADCPALEEKYKYGPERTKIAHVPNLRFEREDSEEGEDEEDEEETRRMMNQIVFF